MLGKHLGPPMASFKAVLNLSGKRFATPHPPLPPPHPFRTKYALTSKRTRIIMQEALIKNFGHQRPRAPGTNRILGTQQLPTPSRAYNPAGRMQRQTGGLGSRKSAVPARAGRKLGT